MNISVLSNFKKSLADSSRIVSDSRISSSFNNEINFLQSLQKKRPSPNREYIDRSSFNQSINNYDNNPHLKKIPELISENDELKDKVKQLEEQLDQMQSTNIGNRRNTFSFRQENIKTQQEDAGRHRERMRTMLNSQHSSNTSKSVQSSFGTVRQRITEKDKLNDVSRKDRYSLHSAQDDNQELKDKIKSLQIENQILKRSNDELTQKYHKSLEYKQKNQHELDNIMRNFEETLRRKDLLYQKQQQIAEQKAEKTKAELQKKLKEIEQLQIEKEKWKAKAQELSVYQQQGQNLMQHVKKLQSQIHQYQLNLQLARQSYLLSENVEHLWKIKEVEFKNATEVLNLMKGTSLS